MSWAATRRNAGQALHEIILTQSFDQNNKQRQQTRRDILQGQEKVLQGQERKKRILRKTKRNEKKKRTKKLS